MRRLRYIRSHPSDRDDGRYSLRDLEHRIRQAKAKGFGPEAVVRMDYDLDEATDSLLIEEVQ